MCPVFTAKTNDEYGSGITCEVLQRVQEVEKSLVNSLAAKRFSVDGFCLPCNRKTTFTVDMCAGGRKENGVLLPNWRERLVCPRCKMSNRQRLVATLIMQHLESCASRQDVYLMEQITPMYKWIAEKYHNHSIVGSEYFGSGYQGSYIVGPLDYQVSLRFDNLLNTARRKFSLFYLMLRMGGVRHEDITRLSFPDVSLDLILSNDVFEHVPNPDRAFSECMRVLRPGGMMFATIPFHSAADTSVTRATLSGDGLKYLLPPMYHGNPLSEDGSLVFTDFGWDVLKEMEAAGFSDVRMDVYASAEFGHLGGGQLVFRLLK